MKLSDTITMSERLLNLDGRTRFLIENTESCLEETLSITGDITVDTERIDIFTIKREEEGIS